MFFPKELTQLIQSIYVLEDLRDLDLSTQFLRSRNNTLLRKNEYMRKLKKVSETLYPNEVLRTHSFRKYFMTQISRVNLTEIRNDIGSDVENNFKQHLLGHKVHYSSNVYVQITNDINQFYELWKPLERSLSIDLEIVDKTDKEILNLKEKIVKQDDQINSLLRERIELKKEIDKLNRMTNTLETKFKDKMNEITDKMEKVEKLNFNVHDGLVPNLAKSYENIMKVVPVIEKIYEKLKEKEIIYDKEFIEFKKVIEVSNPLDRLKSR